MVDIIPSFYRTRNVEDYLGFDGFDNTKMRIGEVKRIIYPEDTGSRSKRFIEYDVYVQHRENGTAVTKMYHNCWLANDLASLADYNFRTLRADTTKEGQTAGLASDESRLSELGFGAKVLIHCINGADSEAVIVSGIRDERQTDIGRKTKGHHMEWEFNGVRCVINDDGSFSMEYRGPTTPEGKLDTKRGNAEAVGTRVAVAADGSFEVATKDRRQSVVIDHKAGTISVTGDKDLTLHAENIHIGAAAGESAVLGDTLVSILGELLDTLASDKHPTPSGMSGPPKGAPKYKALKRKFRNALSRFITVKKNP